MRPGQLTPENKVRLVKAALRDRASMRPGQLTPENARLAAELEAPPAPLQ